MNLPVVSVIIPTFNEEKRIADAIHSLKKQKYPISRLEIIVIDDNSTDNTMPIAKKAGARVLTSGARHIERSKSIGIEHAKGELLLFVDADIRLVGKTWLRNAVLPLMRNKNITAAQAIYWKYSRLHNIYNRYCELFGVNDPFVFMLGKRGVMTPLDRSWMHPSTVISETPTYFLVKIPKTEMPTVGSQGYLVRKSLIKKYTSWEPYFFHLDTALELIEKGKNIFALMKLCVEHDYVDSFFAFHKKLYRNLILFFRYRKLRKYTYGVGGGAFILTTLLMITLVYPLSISIRGFRKKPDIAWFLHPIFCITVPAMYTFITLKQYIFHTYDKS